VQQRQSLFSGSAFALFRDPEINTEQILPKQFSNGETVQWQHQNRGEKHLMENYIAEEETPL